MSTWYAGLFEPLAPIKEMKTFCVIVRVLLIWGCSPVKEGNDKEKVQQEQNRGSTKSTIEKQLTFQFVSKDFERFYNRFKSDSVFQISRIKFPLKGRYQSYEEEREWTRKEWPLIKWDFREVLNERDDSVAIVQNGSKFFLGTYCRDCGFSFEMQFDRMKGEWFLTYRQESNY